MNPSDIITFWFVKTPAKFWFTKDLDFDQLIREKYMSAHQSAAAGELFSWRETALGRLVEIIILDQFSRNLFRDKAEAFVWDGQALVLAQEAIATGALDELDATHQAFLIMPFMHSESKSIHEQAVKHFNRPGLESNLDFEFKHKKIIDRFGRYPHRNKLLGRKSTAEEIEFLEQPGSSF